MSDQLALLPEYLTAHLQLSLLALALGALVSVPLGVVATRIGWLEQPVLAVASIIQTIPSLALLAVMVPVLAAINLQSIGFLPAFIGLMLYSILPILRNTVTGIAGVDAALIEAARGVGMTPRQRLFRVELPLAAPVIVAGLRTSAVWIVGTATLSTPVGATSLGNYIFSGLQTRNYSAVLVGCVAAASLAILLDGIIFALEHGVRLRKRAYTVGATSVLAALFAYTAVTFALPFLDDRGRPIRIGAKTFTEQYILSELLAHHIERQTGLETEVLSSLGSTVAYDALRSGQIDVYVDYSGTIWATVMNRPSLGESRSQVLQEVAQWVSETHSVTLVGTLGFENSYVLAMPESEAERLRITTIGDLVPYASDMVLGGDYEFFARAEWAAIQETYGIAFAGRRAMDSSLMYQAVEFGNVDIISAYTTDGRIDALDLRVLEDDRNAIPPYDAILLTSPGLSMDRSEVIASLEELIDTISAPSMRGMNRAVDEDKRSPDEVAMEFLESEGRR